ncbi:CDGSH iron-sulfur domain-containing protein [Kitasatospora sp. NPDC058048]|uniref:CDGSH iron-sulfur domain-containing protein n=1 Tax=Kitasatospora sp. NPDC058048 TaxID=3346313 RepID=UPI0036DAB571
MSASAERYATRLVVVPGGPLLVEGPVEVILPDGTRRLSDRPVVALCACRRSRTYPFCDTSHRRHGRPQGVRERGPGTSDGAAGER